MGTYRYQARLPDGRMQSGMVEALNSESAYETLAERQYDVLSIEEYKGVEAATGSLLNFLNRISAKEMVASIRMLAVMVSASLPLVDAVRNIAKQTKNPKYRLIMLDAANEIEGGAKLSEALAKYPSVFSDFFTNMVRSGETTGQLAEVLNYLADQQEKDYDLFSKLKGAMTYPLIIMSSMGMAAVVLMVYVVPKLTEVLSESGQELPWTTKALITTSDIMVNYWWLLLMGIISLGIAFWAWHKTEYGRYQWDNFKMHLPVVGMVLKELYVVRFCTSMGTLMKGGLTMTQALEIAATVIGNAVWKNMIIQTIQSVNDGEPIVTVMNRSWFVPPLAVQMLAVGEETGRLQEILKRLSDFYARNVANISQNILSLIEPIVMIILGIGVGIMVAAIMLPLYNMSGGI